MTFLNIITIIYSAMKKLVRNRCHLVLNFRDAKVVTKLDITPDEIPTLIPAEILNQWQKNDEKPYYKLQMIEYPIVANGLTYEESFFDSFVNKLKERPTPGSRDGHNIFFGERPQTDLILVGGKLEKNGDGTGRVFFKNYIPPVGSSGSNDTFILENKSDMVHYSLVAYAKQITEELPDGNYTRRIVESLYGERNDAVEYGAGAMKQVTNFRKNAVGVKNKSQGEKSMTKEEVLKHLNALKENGEITLPAIAESMGLKDRLITDEHVKALNTIKELSEKGIKDPVKELETMKAQIVKNDEAVFNALLTEKYGAPGTKEKPNLLRNYAEKELKGATGEELDKKIENLKTDAVAVKLAAELADANSDANLLTGIKEQGRTDTGKKSVITIKG